MDHADVRKELAAQMRSLLRGSDPLPKTLRPYQRETLESLARWAEDSSGTRRAYIQHATGLGKTVLFASTVRACAGLRALIIVPSKVLIAQTARVLSRFVGGMIGHISSLGDIRDENGTVVAVRGHEYQSIVLTTDASFKRNPERLAQTYAPHLIIRDECHWGYSPNSLRAMNAFPEAVVLGYSATPDYLGTVAKPGYLPIQLEHGHVLYGDPERFAKTHFGECLDVRTARWGIENGYLCPLAWGRVEFSASLDKVPLQVGAGGLDYKEADLQRLLRESWPATCEAVRRLYADPDIRMEDRQTIAVCSSVHQAEKLAEAIAGIGIQAACISGQTPGNQREELLRAFNRREVKFLSSVMVLREGWDAPEAEVSLMLRPTKSRVFYEQSLGRVLRLSEDRPDKIALAVDIHFQNTKFAPLSAPVLYGKPGETIEERGVIASEASEAGEKLASPYLPPEASPKLVVVPGIEIEHWADKNDMFEAGGLRWVTMDGSFRFLRMNFSKFWRAIRIDKKQIRMKKGLDSSKKLDVFYCVEDIFTLIGKSPQTAVS